MGSRSSSALDTGLSPSAGPVAILREAVDVLVRAPAVVGVYAVVAMTALLLPSLGNLVGVVAGAVCVVLAYRALGGVPAGTVSFGVRLVVAFIAALIAGFVILVGLLVLVVPGLYLSARLRLVVPAVMLEDAGPAEALGRSLGLTRGHALTVFLVELVPAVLGVTVAAAFVLQSGALAGGTVDRAALRTALRLGGAAATLLTGPLTAAATAVMYGLYGPDATGGDESAGATGRPSLGG